MRSSHRVLLLSALSAPALTACGTVDPRPDFERARAEIRSLTGEAEVHDPLGSVMTREELDDVLRDGLGADEATRLALLNNRRLHAGFLALGVARADFVQAGLLENPSLSLGLLYPDAVGRWRWTADLLGSLEEIWRLPARKALAEQGVELQLLELSRFAGELVATTRAAYYESVAAREARTVAAASLDLARQSLAGVRRQVEAGVATRTDENIAESQALVAETSLTRAELDEAVALRRLAAALSLESDIVGVALTDALPDPAALDLEREPLVAACLQARPDVRAADRSVDAAQRRLALERGKRTPDVSAGISAERPEGGSSADLLVGPAATVELPIFDQHRAGVSRAEYELGERRKEREALLAEAAQELRAAVDSAQIAARAATFAREELLPQAIDAAALAQRAFDLGDTTVLTLMQAQRAALDARRIELEARLDAALSRLQLERAAGAPLEILR